MDAQDWVELELQIQRMRGTLKHARACLKTGFLDEVRASLETVASEAQIALADLRTHGVLPSHERGTRHPPA